MRERMFIPSVIGVVVSVLALSVCSRQPPKLIEPPMGKIIIFAVEAREERIILKNVGDASVDIDGWKLSDGEGDYNIRKSKIITEIGPGETWEVTDKEYNPRGYTRGLMLNNDHDEVYLYDATGTLVDSREW